MPLPLPTHRHGLAPQDLLEIGNLYIITTGRLTAVLAGKKCVGIGLVGVYDLQSNSYAQGTASALIRPRGDQLKTRSLLLSIMESVAALKALWGAA
jgi:hypothetical protein